MASPTFLLVTPRTDFRAWFKIVHDLPHKAWTRLAHVSVTCLNRRRFPKLYKDTKTLCWPFRHLIAGLLELLQSILVQPHHNAGVSPLAPLHAARPLEDLAPR
jgi:hypothetical protein